jgi:hypothetical protein
VRPHSTQRNATSEGPNDESAVAGSKRKTSAIDITPYAGATVIHSSDEMTLSPTKKQKLSPETQQEMSGDQVEEEFEEDETPAKRAQRLEAMYDKLSHNFEDLRKKSYSYEVIIQRLKAENKELKAGHADTQAVAKE